MLYHRETEEEGMAGKFFEELEVGQTFRHQPGRTITEADNAFFTCLTMNPQPLHLDFHAASKAEFGKPLVNSLLTLGIAVRRSAGEPTLGTTAGTLGYEKMLLKALALPADGLILDLEDAVPPDRKVATRPVVKDWLSTREFGARERWVRMNPIWGPLGAADLEETIAGRPDGYVVPKPRHAGDVRGIAQALDRLEQRHGIPHGSTRLTLIATETPEGLLNIREVASASPRVVAVSWGVDDLGAAMGLQRVRDA